MLVGRGAGDPSDVRQDVADHPGGAGRSTVDADGPAAPTLVHEPALDGLRGVAVGVVVLFHLGRLRGGFLGVDLFFVLSGFLITSLLIVEHRSRGSIDLRAFWVRRARRLLPALLVVLAGVSVLLGTLRATGDRPRFRGDALATLAYVANWHRMAAKDSYWDMFSQPSRRRRVRTESEPLPVVGAGRGAAHPAGR
jgi:hypothetical protein